MKKMRHVMLLLTCPTLPKALNKQDSLQHPQVWLCRETSIGEYLWPDVVVDADL
jgi:hypothetical protein